MASSLTLSWKARLVSPNVREGWKARARRTRAQRTEAALRLHNAILAGKLPAGPPWTVRIVRLGHRRMDGDNLIAACKATRDGIAQALGLDDGDPRIVWHYDQQLVGEHGLRVLIEAGDGTWPAPAIPAGESLWSERA